MRSLLRVLLGLVFFLVGSFSIWAQDTAQKEFPEWSNYIGVQSSVLADVDGAYQQYFTLDFDSDISRKVYRQVSITLATDFLSPNQRSSVISALYGYHFTIHAVRKSIFWSFGAGFGPVFLRRFTHYQIGLAVSFSSELTLRLGKRLHIGLCPLVLPFFNEFTFVPLQIGWRAGELYRGVTLAPVVFKWGI